MSELSEVWFSLVSKVLGVTVDLFEGSIGCLHCTAWPSKRGGGGGGRERRGRGGERERLR